MGPVWGLTYSVVAIEQCQGSTKVTRQLVLLVDQLLHRVLSSGGGFASEDGTKGIKDSRR